MSLENAEDSHFLGEWVDSNTTSEIKCDWCKEIYNKPPQRVFSVSFIEFGGLKICGCCFKQIEKAILQNMSEILPWFIKILESKEKQTTELKGLISKIKERI